MSRDVGITGRVWCQCPQKTHLLREWCQTLILLFICFLHRFIYVWFPTFSDPPPLGYPNHLYPLYSLFPYTSTLLDLPSSLVSTDHLLLLWHLPLFLQSSRPNNTYYKHLYLSDLFPIGLLRVASWTERTKSSEKRSRFEGDRSAQRFVVYWFEGYRRNIYYWLTPSDVIDHEFQKEVLDPPSRTSNFDQLWGLGSWPGHTYGFSTRKL